MIRYQFVTGLSLIASLWSSGVAAQRYVPLYHWYGEARADNFTTSDPAWAGEVGAYRAEGGGYRLVRIEGALLNPALPAPADSVPVFNYWNPARSDNFLSSNPTFAASAPTGYVRVRLEGYAYSRPHAGTVPLINLYSGPRTDNYATADPRADFGLGLAAPAGFTPEGANYRTFRVEGYVLPPPAAGDLRQPDHLAMLTKTGFGDWRPIAASERGVRPASAAARAGARVSARLVIIPYAFADMSFNAADLIRFAGFATASNPLSLDAAIRSVSRGRLTWPTTLTPVVRDPLRFDQLIKIGDAWKAHFRVDSWTPESFRAAHGFEISAFDTDGDGLEADELEGRTRVLKLANPVVNFARFDANRDGRVDETEVQFLRFGADPGIGGQNWWSLDLAADGKTVRAPVNLVAKDTTRAGLAHELLHSWGGIDVYGPGFALNFQSTIMSGMAGDDSLWQLDPWHMARFGWQQPKFVSIGASGAHGMEYMLGAGHDFAGSDDGRPIVFFDPRRGLDEFFMAQYRTRHPRCPAEPGGRCANYPDNGAADTGFAVWHVVTNGAGGLSDIRKRDDTGDRVAWPEGTAEDGHMFRMGVISPLDGKIGGRRYLRGDDAEMTLTWWDGADTGIRLRAGIFSAANPSAALQWRKSPQPLLPRLDLLGVAGFPAEEYPTVNAGQTFHLDGKFGVEAASLSAKLIAEAGGEKPVTIVTATPSRMVVRLPTDAAVGRHRLVIGRATGGAWSNGLKLQIPFRPVATVDLPRDFDLRAGALPRGALELQTRELPIDPRGIEPIAEPPSKPAIPPARYDESKFNRAASEKLRLQQSDIQIERQLELKAPPIIKQKPEDAAPADAPKSKERKTK